jgi:hypothetical protein
VQLIYAAGAGCWHGTWSATFLGGRRSSFRTCPALARSWPPIDDLLRHELVVGGIGPSQLPTMLNKMLNTIPGGRSLWFDQRHHPRDRSPRLRTPAHFLEAYGLSCDGVGVRLSTP